MTHDRLGNETIAGNLVKTDAMPGSQASRRFCMGTFQRCVRLGRRWRWRIDAVDTSDFRADYDGRTGWLRPVKLAVAGRFDVERGLACFYDGNRRTGCDTFSVLAEPLDQGGSAIVAIQHRYKYRLPHARLIGCG